jgi:hypothetical protein
MRSVLGSQNMGIMFLVYTSTIMFVLRFFAGPIVHKLSPLGLLVASAAVACGGLLWLANAGAGAFALFAAATFYGLGKTFFWPTTLGVVSEQYPKGGALLLNGIAGVGMLAVGVLGGPAIGAVQDRDFSAIIRHSDPAIAEQVLTKKAGMFGEAESLDQNKFESLDEKQKEEVERAVVESKQGTLAKIAILPGIMFVCYLVLLVYFRSKGGYEAQVLTGHAAHDEDYTGGVQGPVEA